MAAAHLIAVRPPSIDLGFGCSKKQYPTRSLAMKRAKQYRPAPGLVQSTIGALNVYQCNICAFWHLGHK